MGHARRLLPAVLLLAGTVAPAFAGKPEGNAKTKTIVTATYQVADLVVPVGDAALIAGRRDARPAKPPKTTEEDLIKRLKKSVAPASWVDAGGGGSIDYFPLSMSLVVNQTPAVQGQIHDWLTALRRQNETQVAFEIRFISRSAAGPAAPTGKVTYLDDADTRRLVEDAQADTRANLMQAPKMTLLNNQNGTFECTTKEPLRIPFQLCWENGLQFTPPRTERVSVGTKVSLHPALAADCRSVNVDLDLWLSAIDSEPSFLSCQRLDSVRVSTTVTPKFGQTVRLELGRREVKIAPEPVLFFSDLPVVGSLVKELGSHSEEEQLFVLVTPRLIREAEASGPPPAGEGQPVASPSDLRR